MAVAGSAEVEAEVVAEAEVEAAGPEQTDFVPFVLGNRYKDRS